MQTYQTTVRSNTLWGFIGSIMVSIFFFFGALLVYIVLEDGDPILQNLFPIIWTIFFGILFMRVVYYTINPQSWEFVMDQEMMRWGNTKAPEQQIKWPVQDIASMHLWSGMDEDVIYAVHKNGDRIKLPYYAINSSSGTQELEAFLKSNCTEIEISDKILQKKA